MSGGCRGTREHGNVAGVQLPSPSCAATAIALVLCAVASGHATPVAGAAPAFGWPLEPRPAITREFDPPAQDWLPGHRGVDLAAHPGQTVLAAGDGTVAFAGTVAGKPVVSIDHAGGLRTTYEPVVAAVTAGRRVRSGDPLGTVSAGHDGCPVPACLHWGLRRGRDDYLDPLPLVQRPVIRLLPVDGG